MLESLKRRARQFGGLIGAGNPAPIELPGRAPGVLALHGFTGTPLEVELVCDAAAELGLEAHAPLLPGHGTHARELARLRWSDWVDAAESAFDALERTRGPVVVAGLSMGALLAAHLASRHPERVAGLVLLANAAWLTSPFPSWPLMAIAALKLPDFAFPKFGSDIGDAYARSLNLTYSSQPVHAAIEVLKAGRVVQAKLGDVRCPTLILHGGRDRVCPARNAERVAELLGTRDRRVVILPESHHIVTRDIERAEVRRELRRFFQRFAGRDHTPVEP